MQFQNLITGNIKDSVFEAIWNIKNHPSILTIQKYSKNKIFHFDKVDIGEIEKKIVKLRDTLNKWLIPNSHKQYTNSSYWNVQTYEQPITAYYEYGLTTG